MTRVTPVTDAGERRAHVAPRLVIFDLDGTLVDSLPTIAAAMSAAMRAHGFHVEPAEVIPRIGPPMDVLVQQVAGASPEVASRVNERFMRLYYDGYIRQTPPIDGAGALLDRLAAAGVRLAVLTNKVEAGGRHMLDIQGWAHRFDLVLGRDSPARPKPAPDGALEAACRLGVAPGEAAIVGDTEYDMRCGRDAALRYVVGVVGQRTAAELRAAGATHVVRRLDEAGEVLLRGASGVEGAA